MNRIVKLLYTAATVNCSKPLRGFSALQYGNVDTSTKCQNGSVRSRGFSTFFPPLANSELQYLCRRNLGNLQSRNFSSSVFKKDELSIEQEAERKIGWLLKLIFFGTASVVGYNLFPYMGENLMQQSVALLHVKDPLFKRIGASRLARFAIDDKRRMKIVELGGAKELLNVLAAAKDDRTRKAALKALVAISKSDGAVAALHEAGAIPIIRSTPDSIEHKEIEEYKTNLISRFRNLSYDITS